MRTLRRRRGRRTSNVAFAAALKSIGLRLRELRRARRWSQASLARITGISRTYLGTIELGAKQATLNTFVRLAQALDVSLTELFLPPTTAVASQREIVARIESKLLDRARTVRQLQQISALVDVMLQRT